MNPYVAILITALIAIGLLTAIVVAAAPLFASPRQRVVNTQSKQPTGQEESDIAGTVVRRLNPSNRRWTGR